MDREMGLHWSLRQAQGCLNPLSVYLSINRKAERAHPTRSMQHGGFADRAQGRAHAWAAKTQRAARARCLCGRALSGQQFLELA